MLGCQDETWWSRLALPALHSWAEADRPLRLVQRAVADDIFLQRTTPLERPLFEVPTVLVQYMVLYYFSILARYYGLEWQRLLTATQEPEGYVFRTALEVVAYDYVLDMSHLLTRIGDEGLLSLPSSTVPYVSRHPPLSRWYRNSVERLPRAAPSSSAIAPSA